MNLVSWPFQFLVSLAVLSTGVLAVGALILHFLKQPIERVRCIQFTLAALVFAMILQQTAVFPKLLLPVLPARTGVASLHSSVDQRLPSTPASGNHQGRMDFGANVDAERASQFVEPTEASVPVVTALGPSISPETPMPSPVSQAAGWLQWSTAQAVLTLTCVSISAYFSLLLVAGLYRLFLLRRRSKSIDPSKLEHWQHAAAARKRRLKIVTSNEILVPIAFGVFAPTIAIPASMLTESEKKTVFYCLSHEWAHINSWDVLSWWLVQLLQPLLWFQPFYWRLQHELRMAQDQLADNFAAGEGNDRTSYAQLLTDMAYAQLGIPFRMAVSMAGKRSSLYRRIECLLTSKFTLASRARSWVSGLTVGCLLSMATVLGMARLGPAVFADDERDPLAKGLSASDDGATEDAKSPGEFRYKSYSGRVIGEDGKPIANATLWASRTFSMESVLPKKVAKISLGKTNAQGAFHVEIDETWLNAFRPAGSSIPSSNAQVLSVISIVAQAQDHGLAGLPMLVFADGVPLSEMEGLQNQVDETFGEGYFKKRTIRLPQLSRVAKGRLLDLQGEPIANVSVTLEAIESPNAANLLTALEKEDSDAINRARFERGFLHNSAIAARLLAESQPKIMTNSNGEFEFRGLGKDQLAVFTFASKQFEAARIHVLGREMDAKRVPHISFYPKGAKDVYYGTSFSHVLGPAIPVTGTVTEYQSGKPIADAVVYVERLFTGQGMADSNPLRMRTQFMRTTTDEKGRYALHGLPPGGEHVIEVVPPKTEPWLISSNSISLRVDENERHFDVQVFRGIWIEGEFTDGKTDEPLFGAVDYLALSNNPNIPQAFGLRDGWKKGRFPVGKLGRYRVVGLPGPGVLLARSYGKRQYPLAVGAEKVDGYEPDSKFLPTTPTGMPLSNWNRVQQIDPPKSAESFSFDLSLMSGDSVTGQVDGPREFKKFELEATGLNDNQFWSALNGSKFVVQNYDAKRPRRLLVRTKDRSLVGTLLVEGASPTDLIVKLQPSVTITGRLIETETDEAAVGYAIHCRESTLGNFRVGTNSGSISTDEDGRFEISGLLAGIEYSMLSSNVQRFSSGKNDFKVDLTNAKPGSKINLGDVTGKNATMN